MTLPTIYKKTKTGAVQQCTISTSGDAITVTFGQVDGKQQSKTTICTSKNIGRSNATTGPQQAILEAKAKHQKKLDAGYSVDPSGELTVQLAMRVQTYQKVMNNVKFPCVVMTKYNGANGTFRNTDIESRNGKACPAIPHLDEEITQLRAFLKTTTLNGELFIEQTPLEDIMSAVKKTGKLSPSLEFRVFALPDSGLTFKEVADLLNTAPSGKYVKPCRSVTANSHEELVVLRDQAVAAGYEGIVIYNEDGEYEYNVRSSDVFKFKPVEDGEFKILSYETDNNGHPVFTCECKAGNFKVKPKGTAAQKLQIIADFYTKYLNQWYKVEFEMLSKRGIPLKPIGICLRNCDADGNPQE